VRIAEFAEEESCFSVGEIEVDESYFGARRVRGKRGRGAAGKTKVLETFGYAPHVTKAMVYAFGGEHNINISLHKGDLTYEYASMIADQKTKELNLKEPTIAIIRDSIKQALCFQALKKREDIKELTPSKVLEIHTQANALSKYINEENIRILKDKNFVKEAISSIGYTQKSTNFEENNINRIIDLNHKDLVKEYKLQQIQKLELSNNKSIFLDFNL
jgi:hypothetical protein